MARPAPSPESRLVRLGLSRDEAVRHLRAAGLWAEEGPVGDVLDVLGCVAETATPDDALRSLCSLAEQHRATYDELVADEGWLARFVAVAGASRPLGELLARTPDAVEGLRRVWAVEHAEIADRVETALAAAATADERSSGVAHIRRRATADIAARDLTGEITVEQVATELSELAQGVLEGTLRHLHGAIAGGSPASRIAVIGMGKLGGQELNYVSDVDVVFVHAPTGDDDDAARREARQVCEQLLTILNASTTMGRAYEVDPTLRPEGRQGALTRTVEGFVAYWQRWAKTWEFQALIKARPVAGDDELGRDFLLAAEPFVWPRELDPDVVREIREMKGRVEQKPEVRRHGERQVKLGPGGLRDIEFAVQLLQIVHGRADFTVRSGATLPALGALAGGGYIAEEDAAALSSAYRSLRSVEHHLQLANERRTHTIPEDEADQERLARSLGYRAAGDTPARAALWKDLTAAQRVVRDLHAKLFYRPLLEAHARVDARHGELAIPGAQRAMGEGAAVERLHALGFADARQALRRITDLTSGVSRRARTMRAVLPAFLDTLADTADPDTGLRMLERILTNRGDAADLLATLRDHPPATELLARVLGTSEVAGELIEVVPQSGDWLADRELREKRRTRDELTRAALKQLSWHDDLEGRTAALRRFKRRELLRLVLRDLSGSSPGNIRSAELTALGEACLVAGLQAVVEHLDEEPAADVAVIGMGKFGGVELHYPSDLDVLFVHRARAGRSEDDARPYAHRVAELLIHTVGAITAEGTAFEIDTELRPEGKSGPITRSLDAYRAYYERWSDPWEHQALLRARPVAGDLDLGRDFLDLAVEMAYPDSLSDSEVAHIRTLKARMERERVPSRVDPRTHLKLGPGGISDVEWTVQLLQLRHGRRERLLRVPGTMSALDSLQDLGLIRSTHTTWLREGYNFLGEVRNALYLLRQRSVDVLPSSDVVRDRLALALGYGRSSRQEFEEDYRRRTRRVRRACEELFYDIGDDGGLRP